jgi:PhnB protein
MTETSGQAQQQTLTLAFVVRGAAAAIDFYVRAFGAQELFRIAGSAETIAHAQLRIGSSVLFLSDEVPDALNSYRAPAALGGTTFVGYLSVGDADTAFSQAVAAGAAPLHAVSDQPWGSREGLVRDPFGHLWALASRKPA